MQNVQISVDWDEIEQNGKHTNKCAKGLQSNLIILLGSTPQLAAITTFGSACSIRVHSSLAAKPDEEFDNKNKSLINSFAFNRNGTHDDIGNNDPKHRTDKRTHKLT